MVSVWEAVFMLVVLKIPVVYLGIVVWWAIRAEPLEGSGGDPALVPASLGPCDWDDWRRRRRRVPVRPRPSPVGRRSGSAGRRRHAVLAGARR